jgi:hypothetical protein
VTVTGSGSGSGSVTYTISANTGTSSRSAAITIGGVVVDVNQGPVTAPSNLRIIGGQ